MKTCLKMMLCTLTILLTIVGPADAGTLILAADSWATWAPCTGELIVDGQVTPAGLSLVGYEVGCGNLRHPVAGLAVQGANGDYAAFVTIIRPLNEWAAIDWWGAVPGDSVVAVTVFVHLNPLTWRGVWSDTMGRFGQAFMLHP